jgi:DNA primase
MFDNDKAGRDAMRDLLKQGKEVFLWDKFIKEQRLTEIKKLKDLNDLIIACYQNKLDSYKYLNSYFSSNSLDSFYV